MTFPVHFKAHLFSGFFIDFKFANSDNPSVLSIVIKKISSSLSNTFYKALRTQILRIFSKIDVLKNSVKLPGKHFFFLIGIDPMQV